MRVLLLSALVASTYATLDPLTPNADFNTEYAAGTNVPAIPQGIIDAGVVYDTALTTQRNAFIAALDLATPDYAAAQAAQTAAIAACDVFVAAWEAGSGTAAAPVAFPATADEAAYETNAKVAIAALLQPYYGTCADENQADIADLLDAGADACTDAAATNVWTASATAAATATTDAAAAFTAYEAEVANTAGYCVTTFADGGLTGALVIGSLGRDLTAAEIEGVWPTPTTAAPSTADESATSPAAAVAAGVAAIALLL